MATHMEATSGEGMLRHKMKGISVLLLLLWCYFLTTADAGNKMHNLTNGTSCAATDSITMQEAYSATNDIGSRVEWKPWTTTLTGLLLLMWCYFLATFDAGNKMYNLTNGTSCAATESITMQEAYSATTVATNDFGSRVDWKPWTSTLTGLLLLLWCYFLTTVDAGNKMHNLTNGTSCAATESITMQEAYSATTEATNDFGSRVDWKPWTSTLTGLVGLLVIAWNVTRWCCSNSYTNYLVKKQRWRLVRFLRCTGALKYARGLLFLLWCYPLVTVDAAGIKYNMFNGTSVAATESINMEEAYSATTKATQDSGSQSIDWTAFVSTLAALVGLLATAWVVLRQCCANNCTGYLKRKQWSRLLRFLRCIGALEHTSTITIDEDTGCEWTSAGLSVSPKIYNFDDFGKVTITYSYLDRQKSFPFSVRLHVLKDIDTPGEGVLTAVASDGIYKARCQIPIPRSPMTIPPSITINNYEWTCEGLSVSPDIDNFDDKRKVTITYDWDRDLCESQDNNSNTVEDDDQTDSVPLLPPPPPHSKSFPFSERPHVLKELDITWHGVLTIKALDERCEAQCQIDIPRDAGFDLNKIKTDLKKIYNEKFRQIELLPWNEECNERKVLKDLFVELDLEQEKSDDRDKEMVENSDQKSLLKQKEGLVKLKCKKNANRFAKRVVLKGITGSGKSTLLEKLAYDWSQEDSDAFEEFELVFALRLSEFRKGTRVVDAIDEQILELDQPGKDGLETYMKQNPSKVLLLMDGWDETDLNLDLERSSDDMTIERVLSNKILSKSCVILSTRPHKPLTTAYEYVSVKVKGFSKQNVGVFIDRFFTGLENADHLSTTLKSKLEESPILMGMCNTPVILVLLCIIWKDTYNFPDTLTGLYEEFTKIIWLRYLKRHQLEGTTEQLADLLGNLGQMALNGLLPDSDIWEDILTFRKDDFDSDDLCKLGLKVGFITRQRKLQGAIEKSTFSFIHKSIQEFLAGKYLANLFKNHPKRFGEKLNLINSWKLVLNKFEVLKFCCGISGVQPKSSAATIIGHLINKYDEFPNVGDASFSSKGSWCTHGCDNRPALHIVKVGGNISGQDSQYNILPILTLLYEAQLKEDAMLTSLFLTSVFSNPLGVNILGSVPCMRIFQYFLEVVSKVAANITYIRFLEVTVASAELIQDILSIVPHLEDLDIQGDEIMAFLKSNLRYHLSMSPHAPLRHVDFSDILIGGAISSIGAIMTSNLTCLILHRTYLSENHIEILSAHLSSTPNLQMLDLSRNKVGNNIDALTQNLQHCKKMQSLMMRDASLNESHVKTLIDFLSNWSVHLLELDLGFNPVGRRIAALVDYLQHCNQMTLLNLAYCDITAGGIETLSAVLPRTLMELSLRGNEVGDKLVCIIDALQHCEDLSVLALGSTHLTDAGVVELGRNLHRWCNVSYLDLGYNHDIGNTGLDSVLRHIHHLTKLSFFLISVTIDSSCSALVKDCVHAVGETIPEGGGLIGIDALNKEVIKPIMNLSKAASESGQTE